MTYSPYLIANYSTGVDKRLQPWLIPDDAQEQLFDGYVYRGTMSKREGYKYLATGGQAGLSYRESRIVRTLTAVPMVGAINGVNKTYTLAGNGQIARGSVGVISTVPLQGLVDAGSGVFVGAGTGTINYLTGAISVTFTAAPTAGTVTVTYSYMPGNPVMMIANFVTSTNIKELIVADTRYVNRYNSTSNILEDISPAGAYTGTKFDFFTWVNYASATNTPRLLFCNNVDVIQQYDGTTVTNYAYSMLTTPTVAVPVPAAVTTLTCSWMAEVKDRLILLRTTENGIVYPQRIRISGTGANSDDFRTSAIGAGVIDIPDGTWINGAAFNRDDLIIFTEQSTWVLKYTGNDTTPFVLDKIDESRGCSATFSAITYLNRTSAASKRGLIMTDGYRVERQDESIPDFTFDEVNNGNVGVRSYFSLCFAGSVDADRDHYLIYPPQGEVISKRILTTNYDEDNYAIYRLPLSCMGTFTSSSTKTWADLSAYPNWASLAAEFGNWYSFSFTDGVPVSIGGGHNGEIWQLAVTEQEDNPVRIYSITVVDDTTIQVVTDWNNYSLNLDDQEKGADYIFLTAIVGMGEINNQQFPIIEIINNNTFNLDVSTAVTLATNFTPYTSGGVAQRVIPFSALFKKFNPFVDQDKKVRCGWLYMYVDSTGTSLQRNLVIDSITQSDPCVITTEIDHNLETGDQVNMFNIGGMVELNGLVAFITFITPTSFSLDGIDSSGFTAFTSGGYIGTTEKAKISIDIFVNDKNDLGNQTQLNNLSQDPYQGNCSNLALEDGSKKWYKVFINQTGRFIQFKLKNRQAGANIHIQATMPGFQPVGRLI